MDPSVVCTQIYERVPERVTTRLKLFTTITHTSVGLIGYPTHSWPAIAPCYHHRRAWAGDRHPSHVICT